MENYVVRVIRPIPVLDRNGLSVDNPPVGRRALMPKDEAVKAAQRGDVEMLSPDGRQYMTRVMTAQPDRFVVLGGEDEEEKPKKPSPASNAAARRRARITAGERKA